MGGQWLKNSMREVQFAHTDIQPICLKQQNLKKMHDLNLIYMNTPYLYLLYVYIGAINMGPVLGHWN